MKKEDKVLAYSMRLDGCSFREIAEKLGVTKQAVQQAIPSIEKRAIKEIPDCVYPNIYAWMKKRMVSVKDFSTLCNVAYVTIRRTLSGETTLNKTTIDKILEVTEMTYEEAFRKAEKDKSL